MNRIEKINVNYCFMDELYGGKKFDARKFRNARAVKYRKVGNDMYKDPDKVSKKLYEYQKRIWSRKLPNEEMCNINVNKNGGEYYLNFNIGKDTIRVGSDYIGPSATGAFKKKIDSDKVGEYILNCRTIGGHIFWPKCRGSINQKKAYVNDRMDITLCELKDYYLKPNYDNCLYSKPLRNAFSRQKKWLQKFGNFEGFVDFFLLKGSFVDENYNVIMFAPVEKNNGFIPTDYNLFMENNKEAIKLRNYKIEKFCEEFNI